MKTRHCLNCHSDERPYVAHMQSFVYMLRYNNEYFNIQIRPTLFIYVAQTAAQLQCNSIMIQHFMLNITSVDWGLLESVRSQKKILWSNRFWNEL